MSLHFDISPQIEERFTEAPYQCVADVIREIGLASFEPTDLSERVDEYLLKTGFGETKV